MGFDEYRGALDSTNPTFADATDIGLGGPPASLSDSIEPTATSTAATMPEILEVPLRPREKTAKPPNHRCREGKSHSTAMDKYSSAIEADKLPLNAFGDLKVCVGRACFEP